MKNTECEKVALNRPQKGYLLPVGAKRGGRVALFHFILKMCVGRCDSFFCSLYVLRDHRSIICIDLRVINKLSQVGKFTHMESVHNEDQLYINVCIFTI